MFILIAHMVPFGEINTGNRMRVCPFLQGNVVDNANPPCNPGLTASEARMQSALFNANMCVYLVESYHQQEIRLFFQKGKKNKSSPKRRRQNQKQQQSNYQYYGEVSDDDDGSYDYDIAAPRRSSSVLGWCIKIFLFVVVLGGLGLTGLYFKSEEDFRYNCDCNYHSFICLLT